MQARSSSTEKLNAGATNPPSPQQFSLLQRNINDLVVPDRNQTIFGEIPILFACAENTSASPAPGGGGLGGGGAQLDMRLPLSPANVTQGTMLQLGGPGGGGGGWPRSVMSSPGHYGPQPAAQDKIDRFTQQTKERSSVTLLPEPRRADILPERGLMSAPEIKQLGVIGLFKSEPLLVGKCAALLLKDVGCTYPGCPYCKTSYAELPKTDLCDLTSALRRCMGSASAHSHPGTPRGRSDSVSSDRSVGSKHSDGGGAKPKRHRS